MITVAENEEKMSSPESRISRSRLTHARRAGGQRSTVGRPTNQIESSQSSESNYFLHPPSTQKFSANQNRNWEEKESAHISFFDRPSLLRNSRSITTFSPFSNLQHSKNQYQSWWKLQHPTKKWQQLLSKSCSEWDSPRR